MPKIDGKYQMLDLTKAEVRDAIDHASTSAKPVYVGRSERTFSSEGPCWQEWKRIGRQPDFTLTVDSNCRCQVSMAVL